MLTGLLVIIYLAFISLGLPDSILGSVWPVMRLDIHMPLSAAGTISMIITGGTIISSLFSEKMIKRFGTGKVTLISVFMTALALLGFSVSPSFYWLCILAVPLGLGAGAVDAGLNNFVALHYKAKHMNWLHCFWGIGATGGPLIMSLFLSNQGGWRKGYQTISFVQFGLVVILVLTLPLWRSFKAPVKESKNAVTEQGKRCIFSLNGAKVTLLSLFCYSGIESTAGLWGSSYLVNSKGVLPETAATWVSFFYMGITVGRLVSGFISMKINNKNLIRMGQITLLIGGIVFLLPLPTKFCIVGFILYGLGCAPIYPSILHETPKRFGEDIAQSMMGYQMAFAYVGSTCMPPLFGLIALAVDLSFFPVYILIMIVIMIVCAEKLNHNASSIVSS